MTQLADITLDLSALGGLNVPHIDQYFGVWAMEAQRFLAVANSVRRIDLAAHVARQRTPEGRAALAEQAGRDYPLTDGIAVINLVGPLMKYVGSLQEGTSTLAVRRQIRNAAASPEVAGILLRFDTPGGTVAGTEDLGSDIAAAAARKPVHGYIEDLCASAGYWCGSQTARITANATALVGSIGTFCVVYDLSKFAEAEGVKVHVVKAGEFKGTGVPGTEITDAQLAEYQRMVNGLNDHFLAAVKNGRQMKAGQVKELADGRVHLAAEARSLGLIDGVGSFDQAIADLRKAVKSSRKAGAAAAGGFPMLSRGLPTLN